MRARGRLRTPEDAVHDSALSRAGLNSGLGLVAGGLFAAVRLSGPNRFGRTEQVGESAHRKGKTVDRLLTR